MRPEDFEFPKFKKNKNQRRVENGENYSSLESVNEDFAVDGEREPNTERFLEGDHVLVQVHLQRRRRRTTRHREDPDSNRSATDSGTELLLRRGRGTSIVQAQLAAPKRRRREPQWRRRPIEHESCATRELQRAHARDFWRAVGGKSCWLCGRETVRECERQSVNDWSVSNCQSRKFKISIYKKHSSNNFAPRKTSKTAMGDILVIRQWGKMVFVHYDMKHGPSMTDCRLDYKVDGSRGICIPAFYLLIKRYMYMISRDQHTWIQTLPTALHSNPLKKKNKK